MKNSYYWSDEWSEEFYIELAKAGFISTTHDAKDELILLPELQYEYAILDFKDLHISKKVQKLINTQSYELKINSRFNEVLDEFSKKHKYNWLKGKYTELLRKLYINNDKKRGFEVICVELVCKTSNEIIAGEVGYVISNTYTSLSGFSSDDKQHSSAGTLQLVLLAKYLEENDFEFWNLGHPHMKYKQSLGCKIYSRSDFLKRWNKALAI